RIRQQTGERPHELQAAVSTDGRVHQELLQVVAVHGFVDAHQRSALGRTGQPPLWDLLWDRLQQWPDLTAYQTHAGASGALSLPRHVRPEPLCRCCLRSKLPTDPDSDQVSPTPARFWGEPL